MKQRPGKICSFFVYWSVILQCVCSCSKNHDNVIQTQLPAGKDSSLLIKSIRYASKFVENYYYDSANNKIILTSVTEDTLFPFNSVTELSYNNDHLLSKVIFKFKKTSAADTTSIIKTLFTYDDQNVLQKIEQRDLYGLLKTIVFTKNLMPGGNYRLKWLDQRSSLPRGTPILDTVAAIFNNNGQLISMTTNRPYPVNGTPEDTLTSATITADSVIYDAGGSISQIQSGYTDTLRKINDHFIYFQFTSRDNRGSNLYNQRQLLLRGIANIPISTTILSGEAGVLSIFNDAYAWQYAKYPFQTAILHNQLDGSDLHFNSAIEFDSKDRLTYFKGFILSGERPLQFPDPSSFFDFRITYFK
ncbi:MAG: hypothetical protein JWR61_3002 [Ferruginibacter sp.]|uniref:hypothetical protein n=1 Tax=Ferruginibacter sp. TaxID=1940288 RepID=UPI0026595088|nr:hypothetical protein [Ferruginibacter sp.]MDB5278047.1 hypothetical protein [Ferruginibacter sp.]